MDLSTPVSALPMVGPTFARRLEKLGITTVEDLLHHYPHRYEDLSLISKISELQPGEIVTIKGKVMSAQNVYTRRGRPIQKATIADATGQLQVTWFNQPFLIKALTSGTRVALAGKVDSFGTLKTLTSPEYEIIRQYQIHTGRLVPIYPETAGLSSKWLRSRIYPLLKSIKVPDYLPQSIRDQHQLINLSDALQSIHFPVHPEQSRRATSRLSFDELFLLQLQTLKTKADWHQAQVSHAFTVDQDKVLQFINRLPFKLTSAQNQAVKNILTDLSAPQPMNRLLQGDVGSGKTVVAAIAIYVAYLNGFQSIFMAPTEILAQQHFNTLNTLFKPLGITISLVTAHHKLRATRHELPAVLVGTHALLHRHLPTPEVGLVIIDEQHRFGVEQRAILLKSGPAGTTPHLLTMTATPIPRTIALTFYADLDMSVLDELPTGRLPVKTWLVPPIKRQAAYNWIKQQLSCLPAGRQAFIICPLIDESNVNNMANIKAATTEYDRLKQVFLDFKLDLLHGKTKSKDKQKIMTDLTAGKIDILVATPVVEVGIDIPNATIMVIEGAERFGLAQLHQLRGRVGRGHRQSYCLLFTTHDNQLDHRRLKYLSHTHNGLKLAELDLKLRGPGHLYGTAQHGFLNLKLASLTDRQLITTTQTAAQNLLKADPALTHHPLLSQKLASALAKSVAPN
ncbi:MAG: ATP-dependent DNA helicase RecG [Candidatus Chisholmbacteria bacterium]|nr:ATP-dependent DNA helicase RecG [Candidatus Chisholmbacteria bacterium]